MSAIDVTPSPTPREMGQQLRCVREASGLTVEMVAAKLRMQKNLIQSLEAGDWDRLGAMVFVRGHLRSYTKLLQIELTGLDELTRAVPVPVTPMVRVSRGRQLFGRLGTQLVYMVITALIGVPVWMAAQRHLSTPETPLAVALELPEIHSPQHEIHSLQPLAESADGIVSEVVIEAPAAPVASQPPAPPPRPLTAMASLLPAAAPTASNADISLNVSADSWVELYAPDGRSVEQALLRAGDERRFRHGQLGRVVLGNADGVTLRVGGEVKDLSPWRRANVARFAVSSSGSIGPVVD